MRSASRNAGWIAPTGVSGFNTAPALHPSDLICLKVPTISGQVSTWTVSPLAPAFANASRYRSGCSIIRWTSRGSLVMRRQVATINGPIVMLGTKCPSITSTWIQSAPAASTVAISSPRRAKSAERIDGERTYFRVIIHMKVILTVTCLSGVIQEENIDPEWDQPTHREESQ